MFMMKEWEYSCPMSHWDESEHKYVQDPIKYVSGDVIMYDLFACTKLTKIKKVELKPISKLEGAQAKPDLEMKLDEDLPF